MPIVSATVVVLPAGTAAVVAPVAAAAATAGAPGVVGGGLVTAPTAAAVAQSPAPTVTGGGDPPFVLGTTKPDATNTGVPAGTTLTAVVGDVTYSTAGAVIEGKDFLGYVAVTANNVTFRNCRFTGRDVGFISKYGLLNCEAATGTTVERCTFDAAFPRFWNAGIKGKSFTALRCDVSAVCDGFHVRGPDVQILGCYLHDFYFHDESTEQAGDQWNPQGWTHNDGIQWHVASGAAANHVVRGNNFYWYPGVGAKFDRNGILDTGYLKSDGKGSEYRRPCVSAKTGKYQWGAALTFDCPSGSALVTNVDIYENWLECGGVLFQTGETSHTHNWGKIRNNRCGNDQYTGMSYAHWYAIRYTSSHAPNDSSGNVWDDVPTVPPGDVGTLLTVGVNQGLEMA